MKEEKTQKEQGMKLEQEEKWSIEEVVTQVDKGELLLMKRVLLGFQGMTKEPKENPFHTQ